MLTMVCRNVLGGNFALLGSPSVGASGAIFGTIAVGYANVVRSFGTEPPCRLHG